ncbi:MAG: GGDEF domain-containing protein [Gemmatimonadota bacterium]
MDVNLELTLWRWSTAVQICSSLMIALFFVVFARSVPTAEARAWRSAWLWNLAALTTTVVFWLFTPTGFAVDVVRDVYLGTKVMFVVALLRGAWVAAKPGLPFPGARQWPWVVATFAIVGGSALSSIPLTGIGGSVAMSLLLLSGGVLALRQDVAGFRWLALGLFVRGGVAVIEGIAYFQQLRVAAPSGGLLSSLTGRFLSISSSFDGGAEWLLALGCVLVSMHRTRLEVESSNRDLLNAQENLRNLADRDPLTGLLNRRAMPTVLRRVQPLGATIVFVDLDDFKRINDEHGHAVGDQALVRFAEALRLSFRPDDSLVRFAGDEFVLVAPHLNPEAIAPRIVAMRTLLLEQGQSPDVRFSIGIATVVPGGNPEEALREADRRMYEAKSQQQTKRAS